MAKTTTIRIREEHHEILRLAAYKQNIKIVDIIDDLLKDMERPTIVDKVGRMLGKIK